MKTDIDTYSGPNITIHPFKSSRQKATIGDDIKCDPNLTNLSTRGAHILNDRGHFKSYF